MQPAATSGYELLPSTACVDDGDAALQGDRASRRPGFWSLSDEIRRDGMQHRHAQLAIRVGVALASLAGLFGVYLAFGSRHRILLTANDHLQSGEGCGSLSLLDARNNASFWTVEGGRASSFISPGYHTTIVVSPRNRTLYANCAELAHAYFSVKLHIALATPSAEGAEGAQSEDAYRLVLAEPSQGPMGVYRYDLSEEDIPNTARSVVFAEVKLEYGYFPGGAAGRPCKSHICSGADLARIMGVEWSGDLIMGDDGQPLEISLPRSGTPRNRPEVTCTTFDPLPVTFSNISKSFAFTSPDLRQPCSMLAPQPSQRQATELRWIHFSGDSNTRHMAINTARLLGLGERLAYTPPGERHPEAWIFHDGSGSGHVVTWRSYFLVPLGDDETLLATIDTSSLSAFLKTIPFTPPPTWPDTFTRSSVTLDHLYFSFGSHAELLTSIGINRGLERMLPMLAEKVAQARSTSFMSTTAVNSAAIPDKFGQQSGMRTNVMIRMANRIFRDFVHSHFADAKFLDIFTLTSTIPDTERADALHFLDTVYDAIVSILWTARSDRPDLISGYT